MSDALVWGGTQHYVPLVGDGNINIILPVTSSGKVSASIVYQGPIKAPIRKGERVAVLRITSAESSATNDIPLYAGDDIDAEQLRHARARFAARAGVRLAAVDRAPASNAHETVETGRFITFEGGEGGGKSTQAGILANRLARAGRQVFSTREPGGSPAAEEIREALLSGQGLAVRSIRRSVDVLGRARRPCRERDRRTRCCRGKWVVCDRFLDSTRAYQGATGWRAARP